MEINPWISFGLMRPIMTQENDRRILDDQRSRKILEIVMIRQNLREKIYQYKKIIGQLEDLSPNPAFPLENGSGDGPESPLSIKDNEDPEDENIDGMLTLHEDMDELIVFGNLSLSMLEDDQDFNRSIDNWMEENRDPVLTQLTTVAQIGGQLTIGNVTGYVCATLVKKFGKSIFCTVVGGIVVLKIAHSRGYINIDWGKVCQLDQLNSSAPEESTEADADGSGLPDDGVWIAHKLGNVRDWVKENSYLVLGFGTGFAFKSFLR